MQGRVKEQQKRLAKPSMLQRFWGETLSFLDIWEAQSDAAI